MTPFQRARFSAAAFPIRTVSPTCRPSLRMPTVFPKKAPAVALATSGRAGRTSLPRWGRHEFRRFAPNSHLRGNALSVRYHHPDLNAVLGMPVHTEAEDGLRVHRRTQQTEGLFALPPATSQRTPKTGTAANRLHSLSLITAQNVCECGTSHGTPQPSGVPARQAIRSPPSTPHEGHTQSLCTG